jgi:hypothetical protein
VGALAQYREIVSKTKSEGRNDREPQEGELRDDEVALVSGGWNLAQNKKAA